MGKKSAAQIKRLKKRAAARGEEYVVPSSPPANSRVDVKGSSPKQGDADSTGGSKETHHEQKLAAAMKLREELSNVDSNADMKAKERRSAKRKAEAIAAQEAGCPSDDLLVWYDETAGGNASTQNNTQDDQTAQAKKINNPYILFVGQLSYKTTKEGLFQHFQKELGKEAVTEDALNIRLLTDPKTKKSRGMAFVETCDPDFMYSCLKLHHTHLDGRRINVERSAGGNRNSDARKTKLNQYRKEQQDFMSETVDKMLADYQSNGDLEENELDEGVVALCKRHSAATVEAALAEYVEAKGRAMDNPSAYLTHIIGRIAVEGADGDGKKDMSKKGKGGRGGRDRSSKRPHKDDGPTKKRGRNGDSGHGHGQMGSKLQKASEFSRTGVDMSISESTSKGGGTDDMSRIFPSMSRGRGRGRGYM